MIVKEQKPIRLINSCGAIYDDKTLKEAVLWYSKRYIGKPVIREKKVFMYGRYPAVSIHRYKIHLHRLIFSYDIGVMIVSSYIHHINGNKLDNRLENLQQMSASEHQSITNKGRKQSPEHIAKRMASMRRTRYSNPHLIK